VSNAANEYSATTLASTRMINWAHWHVFNRLRATEHSRFSVWTFNFPLPEYHYLTLSLQRMVAVAVRFTQTYNWSSTHKATHYRVRYKAQSYAYTQNAQNQIFSKQNKRINHTRILFLW